MKTKHVISFAAALIISAVMVYLVSYFVANQGDPIISEIKIINPTSFDYDGIDWKNNTVMNNETYDFDTEPKSHNDETKDLKKDIEENNYTQTTTSSYTPRVIFRTVLEKIPEPEPTITTTTTSSHNFAKEPELIVPECCDTTTSFDEEFRRFSAEYTDELITPVISNKYSVTPNHLSEAVVTERVTSAPLDDEYDPESDEFYSEVSKLEHNKTTAVSHGESNEVTTSGVSLGKLNEKKLHANVNASADSTTLAQNIVTLRETTTVASVAIAQGYQYYEETYDFEDDDEYDYKNQK